MKVFGLASEIVFVELRCACSSLGQDAMPLSGIVCGPGLHNAEDSRRAAEASALGQMHMQGEKMNLI